MIASLKLLKQVSFLKDGSMNSHFFGMLISRSLRRSIWNFAARFFAYGMLKHKQERAGRRAEVRDKTNFPKPMLLQDMFHLMIGNLVMFQNVVHASSRCC